MVKPARVDPTAVVRVVAETGQMLIGVTRSVRGRAIRLLPTPLGTLVRMIPSRGKIGQFPPRASEGAANPRRARE
jgi:hypothetical protein